MAETEIEAATDPIAAVLKSLGIAGPVFASALAVTYDVGFFFGIDIDFFTFFSFSEHLVFALQAIPFAAPAAACIISWLVGFVESERISTAFLKKWKNADEAERIKMLPPLQKKVDDYMRWRLWVAPLTLLGSVFSVLAGSYSAAFLSTLLAAFIASGKSIHEIAAISTKTVFKGFCGISILFVAFLVGYERSHTILASTTAAESILIDDKAVAARIIRSGERGLLFFAIDSKKVRFVRWEAVKQIESP
jgi:membrane protein YqaA with SNARE-associated domain